MTLMRTQQTHGLPVTPLAGLLKSEAWVVLHREHAMTVCSNAHGGPPAFCFAEVDAGEELFFASALRHTNPVYPRGLTYTDWRGNDLEARGGIPRTPEELASRDGPRPFTLTDEVCKELSGAGYLFARKVVGEEEGLKLPETGVPPVGVECEAQQLGVDMLRCSRVFLLRG
eukprot:Hpha_TRINITY_DN33777_c0_g1::TRINITY_DN33777_c0_g1_i1::g.25172::m.25172